VKFAAVLGIVVFSTFCPVMQVFLSVYHCLSTLHRESRKMQEEEEGEEEEGEEEGGGQEQTRTDRKKKKKQEEAKEKKDEEWRLQYNNIQWRQYQNN
jgi:hypothetical protein